MKLDNDLRLFKQPDPRLAGMSDHDLRKMLQAHRSDLEQCIEIVRQKDVVIDAGLADRMANNHDMATRLIVEIYNRSWAHTAEAKVRELPFAVSPHALEQAEKRGLPLERYLSPLLKRGIVIDPRYVHVQTTLSNLRRAPSLHAFIGGMVVVYDFSTDEVVTVYAAKKRVQEFVQNTSREDRVVLGEVLGNHALRSLYQV